MQNGTEPQDGGRGGRPVKITDEQICTEIEQRLSGHPDDFVAFRIQRTLKACHGSTPQLARIRRLMREMQLQRQAPAPAPRQPEADLDSHSDLVRRALDEAAGQVCRLLAEAVLAAEDAQRERSRRDLAARDSEMSLLRESHASEILRRDQEIEELVRSADEGLEEYQQWRAQSESEKERLEASRVELEAQLRQRDAACADLRLQFDRAAADHAAQQQVAERAQGDHEALATRIGELTVRVEAAETARDQARVALAAEQERSAARDEARVAAEARLHEIRAHVERLEVMLECARQDAGEAGKRVAVLEATLATERRMAIAGREPRPLRTPSGEARQ
jgi:chromosome segregation ATPase